MPTQRQDYLLRLVAQAAAALRRLRERLVGGDAPAEIVEEARAAQRELLGKDVSLLRALEPATAAGLVGDRRRIALGAELVRVEGAALRREARDAEGAALEARADALARLGDPSALAEAGDGA